jgi:hypothetical protein
MVRIATLAATAAALLGLSLLAPAPAARAQEFKGKLSIGKHKVKLEQGKIYQVVVESAPDFVPVVDTARGRLQVVLGKDPKDDKHFFMPEKTDDYEFYVFPPSFGFPKDTTIDYTLKFKALSFGAKPLVEEKSKWDKDDPTYKPERPESHFKPYKVPMKAGQLYVIDLVKGDNNTDPYLYLEDPKGQVVAQDDDSGGNLNARIIYMPMQDGEYRVIATTLLKATGPFTLTVKNAKE